MTKAMAKTDDLDLIEVLGSSLYIGAKKESIQMVVAYCNAAKLDPMQKPVHIVPMNTKDAATGKYEWKDVIMPGIGLYRIHADRSGSMAGISEPEFGPEITGKFKDKQGNEVIFSYPEWCRISVKKIVADRVVEFVAKEFWLENYTSDSRSSSAPNVMWAKRPRGQIAKCSEAQALRKAFPELGAQPTAEEMQTTYVDVDLIDQPALVEEKNNNNYMPTEEFDIAFPKYQLAVETGKKTVKELLDFLKNNLAKKGTRLSPDQIQQIEELKEWK